MTESHSQTVDRYGHWALSNCAISRRNEAKKEGSSALLYRNANGQLKSGGRELSSMKKAVVLALEVTIIVVSYAWYN